MKTVLLVTFALFGLSHQLNYVKLLNDFEDIVDKEAKDCYGEFNLNRAVLDQKLKSLVLPNERNLKCFFNCVITHLNVFDESGNLVEHGFKKYIEVEPVLENKILTACKGIQETDNCEKFYALANCVRKVIQEELLKQ